jgi:DegV family protein with EDD domain
MIVITNPGSNLPADLVRRYDIVLTPQQISVDGVLHDTRTIHSTERVDQLIAQARNHPFVLGTSAAELLTAFRDVGREHREMMAVMTSRKLIGSHDAAVAAVRTLASLPGAGDLSIQVIDSKTTDIHCGLMALFCAASAKAGRPMHAIAGAAEQLADAGILTFVPPTVDYLVKGGRATFLKAWVADILRISPVISLVEGELKSVGKVPRRDDISMPIAESIVSKLGRARAVWAGVAHGNDAVAAMAVAARLRERLDVRYLIVQPLSPSIYLHCGPGAVLAAAMPIDQLGWTPQPPDKG